MSAAVLAEDRERCVAAGMDDFVAKPVRPDVLERTLNRHLTAGTTKSSAAAAGGPGTDPDQDGLPPDVVDASRLQLLRQLDPDGVGGLVTAVVGAFLQECPTRLAAVRAAVAAGSGAALAPATHELKGSAGNLGAVRVAAVCERLETLGRGSAQPGAQLLQQLNHELDAATGALAQLLTAQPAVAAAGSTSEGRA